MKDSKTIFLSVVIPAYNEEKRIGNTLLAVDHFLSQQYYKSEIVVVDDGSSDNTIQSVKGFQKMIKNLRIVDNEKNNGKGYVVRQGLLEAKGQYRLFTDADNSTSIEQVDNLLECLKDGKYDIAIGSRDAKGAELAVPQPFYKEILGKMANILIQIVAVPGIKDTQCGFKCFRAEAAEDIIPRLKINRWGIDIEILAVAKLLRYKIKEVPIRWVNDPNSKVSLKGYLNTFRELFKIKLNLLKHQYDKK